LNVTRRINTWRHKSTSHLSRLNTQLIGLISITHENEINNKPSGISRKIELFVFLFKFVISNFFLFFCCLWNFQVGPLDKIVRVCMSGEPDDDDDFFFLFFFSCSPSVIISWLASALSEISLPIYRGYVRCAPSAQLHARLTNICCLRQIFFFLLKSKYTDNGHRY
jgi:hypothetical protein